MRLFPSMVANIFNLEIDGININRLGTSLGFLMLSKNGKLFGINSHFDVAMPLNAFACDFVQIFVSRTLFAHVQFESKCINICRLGPTYK